MLRRQRLRSLVLAGVLLLGFGLLVSHQHLIRILKATPRLALFPEDATISPGPSPETVVPPGRSATMQPSPTSQPASVASYPLPTDVPPPTPYRILLPLLQSDRPDGLFLPLIAAGSAPEPQPIPPPVPEPVSPDAPLCSDGNYACVKDVVATGCEPGNFACLRAAAPWLPSSFDPWSTGAPVSPGDVAVAAPAPTPVPTATPAPDFSRIFDQSLADLNPSLPADLSQATSPPGYDGYVNSYDYFLSKNTGNALGGLHSLNQIVDGQQSLYMKGWPDRFELHTLGDFIRLKEDHSGAPNPPYTFSDGRWMPREWKPGDILPVRAEENTLQFYTEDCIPTYTAPFAYTMRFVALLPDVNLGGVLGVRSKVLVLEYKYYTDREIFLYDSEVGWVAWQLYQHDQLKQEVRFNWPVSVPLAPDPQTICMLR